MTVGSHWRDHTIRAMRAHGETAILGPSQSGSPESRTPMPATYVICVRGRLGETFLQAFPGLDAEPKDDCTVLRGTLPDQAALHGILAQIEALGLELVEVRQLPISR
jgi:hypothetical protein